MRQILRQSIDSDIDMIAILKPMLAVWLLVLAGGCMQAELGGPVPNASIAVTELRSGALAQDGLLAKDEATFVAENSQQKWDELGDLARFIQLGNFDLEPDNFEPGTLYLVTATGGADMDFDGDRKEDVVYTPVEGTWHAIMPGKQLRRGGYMVSPITEALYQSVKDDIDQLSDEELLAQLDQNTRLILQDLDTNEGVDYLDALSWTILQHKAKFLLDFADVRELAMALAEGKDQASIRERSLKVLGLDDGVVDALQVFTDTISMPIVQSKCINCHVSGGVARNTRLLLVNNSDPDNLTKNHQAFINLEVALDSQDLSDYVTSKVQGQLGHGGGRQLSAGSQDLANLETYLNLLEDAPGSSPTLAPPSIY